MEKPRPELASPRDSHFDMERFFEHLERWKRPIYIFEKAWKPRCDVSETEDEIVVVADLGGVDSDEVDIKVVGSSLILKGVRKEPVSDMKRVYHLMEISYGPFERVLDLPAVVDAERAEAVYDEGFLRIKLPKVRRNSRGVEVDVRE